MPPRTCELCGQRTAAYLCQQCGSAVCHFCYRGWLCKNCSEKHSTTDPEIQGTIPLLPGPLFSLALLLILAGFVLVFIGSTGGDSSGGCFLWPLPFVIGCGFGTSLGPPFSIGIVLALVVLMIASFWLSDRWFHFPHG